MTVPDQVDGREHERLDQTASPAAELMDRMASKLGGKASVSAVYGDPIERGGVTVIPVARVSLGFGVGRWKGPSRLPDGRGWRWRWWRRCRARGPRHWSPRCWLRLFGRCCAEHC